MDKSRAKKSLSKIDETCPLSIPKHDLYNIYVHTKFVKKSTDIYLSYCPVTKIRTDGRTIHGRMDTRTTNVIP